MKNLKYVFLTVCLMLGAFALGSCGSDDDGSSAPTPAFQEALMKLYPGATNVDWEQKGLYYVAECWVNNTEKHVWFDANTNWVMTETELNSINDLLPPVLTAFMESEYANWVVEDVDALEYPNEPTPEFVVGVEQGKQEVDLYFSEEGGLIHVKDVSNGDDTHWPRN